MYMMLARVHNELFVMIMYRRYITRALNVSTLEGNSGVQTVTSSVVNCSVPLTNIPLVVVAVYCK